MKILLTKDYDTKEVTITWRNKKEKSYFLNHYFDITITDQLRKGSHIVRQSLPKFYIPLSLHEQFIKIRDLLTFILMKQDYELFQY
ncbi:unnamed protein product [Paramecium octaurelia]|uniref:Uncharacterized protein n=1 Tax=Paramecium octaurelia TaxID=43137 RepID=A0A8S1S9Y6_PAROT|nr:unnamed protein product [Paramecium octaurelia]